MTDSNVLHFEEIEQGYTSNWDIHKVYGKCILPVIVCFQELFKVPLYLEEYLKRYL